MLSHVRKLAGEIGPRGTGTPGEAAAADFVAGRISALGLPVERVMVPVGCDACGGTGYQGRFLLCEMLSLGHTELGRAILSRDDTATLERLAVQAGMVTRWQRAYQAVEAGRTSPAEVRRVLGFFPGGASLVGGDSSRR